jgi:hypothetical protein
MWSKMIINYLETKCNAVKLFEHIIHAFKIDKRIIEPNRKGHSKTYSDFIKCSVLPRNTEMCFIDNTYYKKMHHNKVYYIQPKPYYHGLKTGDIIKRLVDSNIIQNLNDSIMTKYFVENNLITTSTKSKKDVDEDIFVSRKILFHIQDFFLVTTRSRKTRKNRLYNIGNFTRKTHN